MEEGSVKRTDLGTPQGGVISPLLANIYLNYLDILWERHGKALGELTRYADDMVIVCKTKKDADQAYKLLRRHYGATGTHASSRENTGSRAVDRRRGIRFSGNAPPKDESRNVAGACVLHHTTMANDEGRKTHS